MSVPITEVKLPQSKYGIKCPYEMEPTRIAIHNTANDATAMSEISYMQGNNNEVSYHYAVDEARAVQGLPLNRNGWHTGDGGRGIGNRQSIGIEICYSKSGGSKFAQAERNGAWLTAVILHEKGWGMSKVTKHQDYSGKYCPHRTMDIGWNRFLKMVENELNALKGGKESPSVSNASTYTVKSGDSLWGIATAHGTTVDKIVALNGMKSTLIHPNDKLKLKADEPIKVAPKPVSSGSFKVGQKVTVSNSAKTYSTGQSIPSSIKGKTYTVQQVASGKVLLKEIVSWVRTSDIVGGTTVSSTWESRLPNTSYYIKEPYFSGSGVLAVQEGLSKLYFYPNKGAEKDGCDGEYGGDTENAVYRYQSTKSGLTVDGKYGPKTRAKMLQDLSK